MPLTIDTIADTGGPTDLSGNTSILLKGGRAPDSSFWATFYRVLGSKGSMIQRGDLREDCVVDESAEKQTSINAARYRNIYRGRFQADQQILEAWQAAIEANWSDYDKGAVPPPLITYSYSDTVIPTEQKLQMAGESAKEASADVAKTIGAGASAVASGAGKGAGAMAGGFLSGLFSSPLGAVIIIGGVAIIFFRKDLARLLGKIGIR